MSHHSCLAMGGPCRLPGSHTCWYVYLLEHKRKDGSKQKGERMNERQRSSAALPSRRFRWPVIWQIHVGGVSKKVSAGIALRNQFPDFGEPCSLWYGARLLVSIRAENVQVDVACFKVGRVVSAWPRASTERSELLVGLLCRQAQSDLGFHGQVGKKASLDIGGAADSHFFLKLAVLHVGEDRDEATGNDAIGEMSAEAFNEIRVGRVGGVGAVKEFECIGEIRIPPALDMLRDGDGQSDLGLAVGAKLEDSHRLLFQQRLHGGGVSDRLQEVVKADGPACRHRALEFAVALDHLIDFVVNIARYSFVVVACLTRHQHLRGRRVGQLGGVAWVGESDDSLLETGVEVVHLFRVVSAAQLSEQGLVVAGGVSRAVRYASRPVNRERWHEESEKKPW